MRDKDTASLREFLKGYRASDDAEAYPTDQQERLPMPPMAVHRGGEVMELPERDYVALAAEYPDRYRESLELEQAEEAIGQDCLETPEYRRLRQLRVRREDGELAEYREETDRLLQTLKNEYRKRTGGRRVAAERG